MKITNVESIIQINGEVIILECTFSRGLPLQLGMVVPELGICWLWYEKIKEIADAFSDMEDAL